VKKITSILLISFICAAGGGFAFWLVYSRDTDAVSSRVFGGRKAFDAFSSASEMTAERLHCTVEYGSSRLSDYRRDAATVLSPEQVHQVKNLFSQRDSYPSELWSLRSGESIITTCGPPNYGVLLTSRSTPAVRIALCFRCSQFGVFVGDDDHSSYVNRSDPLGLMRSPLVDLVKSIFPNDSEIRNLQREQ
jgi:hypothetical protein